MWLIDSSSSLNFSWIETLHLCTNVLISFALSLGSSGIQAAVVRPFLISFSSWLTNRTRSFPGSFTSNRSTSELKNNMTNFPSVMSHSSKPSMMIYCWDILWQNNSTSCLARLADVNVNSPLAEYLSWQKGTRSRHWQMSCFNKPLKIDVQLFLSGSPCLQ